MTIIFGESSSGKSREALDLIKNGKKIVYFSLDLDKSIATKVKDDSRIEFVSLRYWPIMADLERELAIQTRFGSNKLTHIVVDPINYIKNGNLSPEKSIASIISDLRYIEEVYGAKVIAIFNTLVNIEKTSDRIIECITNSGVKMIETKLRKKIKV